MSHLIYCVVVSQIIGSPSTKRFSATLTIKYQKHFLMLMIKRKNLQRSTKSGSYGTGINE